MPIGRANINNSIATDTIMGKKIKRRINPMVKPKVSTHHSQMFNILFIYLVVINHVKVNTEIKIESFSVPVYGTDMMSIRKP